MVYEFIINPIDKKQYNVKSIEGQKILKDYVVHLQKILIGGKRKNKRKKKRKKKKKKSNKKTNNKRIKVHQVYLNYDGFWCDIFQQSTDSWQNTGADYKLWGNKEISDLLRKKKYSKIKKLYYSLKLPIQKVDLIRWTIVYDQGGLYCDLDVVNKSGNLDFIKSDTLITKYQKRYETDIIYFDRPEHPMLEGLFDYLQKNYKEVNKKKIYKEWKGRYVLQTFGPYAIDRFLKQNDRKPEVYEFQTQFQDEVLGKESGFIRNKKRKSAVVIYKTSSWMTEKNGIDKVRYIPHNQDSTEKRN